MRRALLALAFAASLLPGMAAAQSGAPTLDGQRGAIAALAQSLAAAANSSPAPRLSDPVQGAVIRTAFDARILPLVDWSDVLTGLDVCDTANKTLSGYMFQGLAGVDLSRPPEQLDPATINKLNANIIRYQDELAFGMAFVTDCMARVVPPSHAFWNGLPEAERTPTRVQGLRQLRHGLLGMYSGTIQTQTETATRLENKRLLLDALVRNNAALGSALSPGERAEAIKAIDDALPQTPAALRPDLTKVRDALKSMPCAGLCKA